MKLKTASANVWRQIATATLAGTPATVVSSNDTVVELVAAAAAPAVNGSIVLTADSGGLFGGLFQRHVWQ